MSGPCCVDPGAKQTDEAQGTEEQIEGINTYKTGQGKSAIIIFTDVFGYSFINVRKMADSFAVGAETTVFIPDLFNEDPMDPNGANLMELLPVWLKKHPTTDATAIGQKLILTIKGHYQSIQIMGICYGGKSVVDLITHPELSSTIKAAVVAHPSFLVKEEAKKIQRPILFLCAENDRFFSSEILEEFKKELTSNGLGTFIEYPGTVHGFVVRPHHSQQTIEQRDKAIQDAIQFFKKHI